MPHPPSSLSDCSSVNLNDSYFRQATAILQHSVSVSIDDSEGYNHKL
jgi:hypothetical protein